MSDYRPDKYQGLRESLRRGDVDPDVVEELQHHLAMHIEELVTAGMSRADAEGEARRRFGDVGRYREETRAVDRSNQVRAVRRERLVGAVREIRRAWRSLRRAPTFTFAAVATLSVGIGATVAIGTILDRVIFRPLPYPAADRLVRIYHPVPKVGPGERWNVSEAEYFHFTDHARSFERVGIIGQLQVAASFEGRAMPVNASHVSASTLDILGATPLLGRLLAEADEARGAAPVAVLGEAFWRRQFGASPTVVGTTIRVEGSDLRVVGVVRAGVDLPDWPAELWVPRRLDRGAAPQNSHVFQAIARLRANASLEAATAELRTMLGAYPDRFPTAYTPEFFTRTGFTTTLVPWRDDVVGEARPVLWILFGAVAVVLLIAGVNVGNLFLVRHRLAGREVAVRSALGADRRHLAWHHLAESLMISLAAVGLGLVLAEVGLGILVRALSGAVTANGPPLPRLGEVTLGWTGVGLGLALGLGAGLVFGLGGLLSTPGAGVVLRHAGRGQTASRREGALRSGLVVAQITFAVVLLTAAGLMLRTFQNLRTVEPGFDPAGVVVADVALPYGKYEGYPATDRLLRQVVDGLRALPGVRLAAVGSDLPLETGDGCSTVEYPDRAPDVDLSCVATVVAGPDYFSVLGVKAAGRDLAWADLDANTGAMIVSDALARRFWPSQRAVDRPVNGPNSRTKPPYRVVGVTQGLRWRSLARDPAEVAFFPLQPIPGTWLWSPLNRAVVVIKAPGIEPAALGPSIVRLVAGLDREVAVSNVRSMAQVVAKSLVRVRVMMVLLLVASGSALLLSVVGLYGVVAYLVTRRTQEIGIRIALGASIRSVRNQVVWQSVRLAGAGVVLGVVGGLVLTRGLAGMLYGVAPGDPVTLVIAALTLLLVAVAASLAPANRATRIDPIEAFRAE